MEEKAMGGIGTCQVPIHIYFEAFMDDESS